MTRDDIIRMAQKAGFPGWWLTPPEPERQHGESLEMLERFAALVAAAERRKHQADIERWKDAAMTAEKWRGMALGKDPEGGGRTVSEIQREAAAAEREACAKLCEKQKSNWNYCAAAIRARSNT